MSSFPNQQNQKPVYIPKKRRRTNIGSNADNEKSSVASNNDRNFGNQQTPPTSLSRTNRKQQQALPRFHGAWTGGFSAGHFNTVGTKEGWTPSAVKIRNQKLEDFMDEEDHAEWGGPTQIRQDFAGLRRGPTTKDGVGGDDGAAATSETNTLALSMTTELNSDSITKEGKPQSSSSLFLGHDLQDMLEIKHETVGPRLLRRLGWREGGSVFVPDDSMSRNPLSIDKKTDVDGNLEDENEIESKIHLSKRRIRRIQLQTSRMKLPPPKLDQCGLGFEPHKNAPEFQRHRQRQKQQAQNRVTLNRDNVYRISDVTTSMKDQNDQFSSNQQHQGSNEEYLSYETTEDFVGSRSSGGFALRDDEDDVYDNQQPDRGDRAQKKITGTDLGDEYHTEIQDVESSSDDEPMLGANKNHAVKATVTNKTKGTSGAANLFAAWATNVDHSTKAFNDPHNAATDDRSTFSTQPPIPGFVMGSPTISSNFKRYAGPDIPRDYEVRKHVFGDNEHPQVYQTISRALQLQREETTTSVAKTNIHFQPQQQMNGNQDHRPMSSNFSSLADAMKSRFTTSRSETNDTKGKNQEQIPKHPAGLYLPPLIKQKEHSQDRKTMENVSTEQKLRQQNVTVTRTSFAFLPEPLVCKRFRIPAPSHTPKGYGAISGDVRKDEATYFEQEILSTVKDQLSKGNIDPNTFSKPSGALGEADIQDDNEIPEGIHRPSLSELRSIFEAHSDVGSSSDESDASESQQRTGLTPQVQESSVNPSISMDNKGGDAGSNRALVEYQPRILAETGDDDSVGKSCNSFDSSSTERRTKSHSSSKKEKKKRKSKKKSHKKEKRKRSIQKRSESPPSGEDDRGRHEQRRKKKKEKKKRKKRDDEL